MCCYPFRIVTGEHALHTCGLKTRSFWSFAVFRQCSRVAPRASTLREHRSNTRHVYLSRSVCTLFSYVHRELPITTARVFKSGNSQAVRLPKEFRFNSAEVEISRRGDDDVLREGVKHLGRAFEVLVDLPGDFLADSRDDTPPQKREAL